MTKIETKLETQNNSLVTRLRAQMIRKGLNPKTLAERANVGRSFVYDILSGRSCNPTSGKIASIADELGVSMQYLLSGVHPQTSSLQQAWADIINISALRVEPSMDSNIIVSISQNNPSHYHTESWITDALKARREDIRSFEIECDSMYPTLKAGDYALLDLSKKELNPPGLFLLFDGVALKPRRLEMLSPEKIIVRADNDKYSAYEASPSELNIIGKIVWLGRNL